MKLQKKGKVLRGSIDYSEAIASALRAELGDTHRAVKTLMKWTGASERAVKNWLAGESGPHGRYLIAILRYSDAAMQTILAASRRLDLLDHLLHKNGNPASGSDREVQSRANSSNQNNHHHRAGDDPNRDPVHGPVYDPDHLRDLGLNDRQIWFLGSLVRAPRAGARTIQGHFNVSSKTAKRDIAFLKSKGFVQFMGTRRRGRYVLVISKSSGKWE